MIKTYAILTVLSIFALIGFGESYPRMKSWVLQTEVDLIALKIQELDK